MKLNYKTPPKTLAGSALPGCSVILKDEVAETLTNLSNDLDMPFDFNEFVVGSTGKRDYSGDLDVVVDNARWGHGVLAFKSNLEEVFGKENVARHGDMLHLKYPIAGRNSKDPAFVQVDFLFGDYKWLKFYHFSDDKSAYKGAHRNLLIAAICSEIDISPCYENCTAELDVVELQKPFMWDVRHTNYLKWRWGPTGFSRIHRRKVKDKHGHWSKKPEDTIIAGPFFDSATIIDILFPGYRNEHALDSLETIMTSVKENYGMVEQEKVWRRAAMHFYDWPDGRNFSYPSEISKYFQPDDK